MASPQKEDGYTVIANELMEALARTRINGEARQVLDVIIRKTYGFNKTKDMISLSQFKKMTNLGRRNIQRGIKKLLELNVIVKSDATPAYIYQIQKNYEKWKVASKMTRGRQICPKVASILSKGSVKNDAYKRNIQKKYTKEILNTLYEKIILRYLNLKTGKHFRLTKRNKSFINARTKEKWTEDDFFYVIDIKTEEWLNTERDKYLRPETLFGTKFESYRNQKRINNKNNIKRHSGALEYLRKKGAL